MPHKELEFINFITMIISSTAKAIKLPTDIKFENPHNKDLAVISFTNLVYAGNENINDNKSKHIVIATEPFILEYNTKKGNNVLTTMTWDAIKELIDECDLSIVTTNTENTDITSLRFDSVTRANKIDIIDKKIKNVSETSFISDFLANKTTKE